MYTITAVLNYEQLVRIQIFIIPRLANGFIDINFVTHKRPNCYCFQLEVYYHQRLFSRFFGLNSQLKIMNYFIIKHNSLTIKFNLQRSERRCNRD